jgi:hypothetical protein
MAEGSGGSLEHRSTEAGSRDPAGAPVSPTSPPSASRASVRLLGPVDVVVDGRPVAPGSRYARTMLAVLAVRAGQVVPADVLIEAMWGPAAPRTARHALHVHASALRHLVPGGPPIVGRPGGYVLQIGPGQLDIDRFEDMAGRARAELSSGDVDTARQLLREALALWRGPALADVPWERSAPSPPTPASLPTSCWAQGPTPCSRPCAGRSTVGC